MKEEMREREEEAKEKKRMDDTRRLSRPTLPLHQK